MTQRPDPDAGFEDLDADPVAQFRQWLDEALASGLREPTALALATAGRDGGPSVRMVLVRGFDDAGLRFYTNYESQKGRELAENARAAGVFYWDPLVRQVRVSGSVEPLSPEESRAYWATRPQGSRIAAWASPQSRPVSDRAELEARFLTAAARFAEADVPLPPHWGGYRLMPVSWEFWQGRQNRLHDRLRYDRQPDGGWHRRRLAP